MLRRLIPSIFILIGAASAAQVPPPPPAPVPADPIEACRAWCDFVQCGESPPVPFVGADSLGALVTGAPYPAGGGGAEGRVVVQFVVRADGSSDSFEVARGVSPALDSTAVWLARSLMWRPARLACWGPPITIRYALPFTFRRPEQ